jgi:hypothetical protein
LLEADTPVEGETETGGPKSYYLIQSPERGATLTYERIDGEYAPEIDISIVDDTTGDLSSILRLSGSGLNLGTVEVPQEEILVVSVGPALFDFAFTTTDAEYTLVLSAGS